MLKVVNLKEEVGLESALIRLENEITCARMEGTTVIVAIHGYGSHGAGGVIKKEVHKLLTALHKSKKIYDFIPGEKWGEMRDDRKHLQKIYPEIILQEQLINLNNGVTIILLKNKE